MRGRTLEERFWSMVTRGPGCWLYRKQRSSDGYGVFKMNGRSVRAHRFSWELANGPIPDGLWVLHRCDTPRCVRPDHLFLGTPRDNVQDAIRKGRRRYEPARGEQNGSAKLSVAQVREARVRVAVGEPKASVARDFGVHPTTILRLVEGNTWREVA